MRVNINSNLTSIAIGERVPGVGGGAVLDELVHKDGYGLPCLPGRTIKGLLRDGSVSAEMWGLLSGRTEQGDGEFPNGWLGIMRLIKRK
ncbi:hypothetical protein BGS_0240 [Beggiatoa sp. SS]|nr:hypothetical protein BGS_0240 [Beggiatoa sp. SS]